MSAPMLTLPSRIDGFTFYCDASKESLDCVLMRDDNIVTYVSRQLKSLEKNYPIHDLE